MVERFDNPWCEDNMMQLSGDGFYVLYSDFAALKAENDRLIRELETATKLKRQYLHSANHWHDKAERALAERAGGVKEAFKLGFLASAEGFNGEHPFDGEIPKDARGKKWTEMRDRILSALTTEPAAPEGLQDDGHTDADGYPYEFTRPAEQAVTEADMAQIIFDTLSKCHYDASNSTRADRAAAALTTALAQKEFKP